MHESLLESLMRHNPVRLDLEQPIESLPPYPITRSFRAADGSPSSTGTGTSNIDQQSPYALAADSALTHPIIPLPPPALHTPNSPGDSSILAAGVADSMERDKMGLAGTHIALFMGRGLGYIRFLAPPEKVLRWIEGKLNLLGRLPHYVSVDQKTYGRYGVLPTSSTADPEGHMSPIGLGWMGTGGNGQRLGP
ncbi:putative rhomboid protease [Cladophialophora chaetospira]|uniref:Rhomboid protease n=1 Tax=Cladophialophora chaetospira TaxID=386627 RepID=A0AA38WYY6_9EURO|nr:putative rhomboid protease [Cladophialophora chaetospira]